MSEYPVSIIKALHEVMAKASYVQKSSRNTFHNYNYASEADLLATIRPAMQEAGLLLLPSAVEQSPVDQHGNTQVLMEYTLAHTDGSVWPEKIRAVGAGNDRNSKGGVGDKGTYKAVTGANKYLLFKLFQIETGDEPEAGNIPQEPNLPFDPTEIRDHFVTWFERTKSLEELNEAFKAFWNDERRAVIPTEIHQEIIDVKDVRKGELTQPKEAAA